jgi:hypothetical protein
VALTSGLRIMAHFSLARLDVSFWFGVVAYRLSNPARERNGVRRMQCEEH